MNLNSNEKRRTNTPKPISVDVIAFLAASLPPRAGVERLRGLAQVRLGIEVTVRQCQSIRTRLTVPILFPGNRAARSAPRPV